ncbi:hypothetical protein ACHAXS_009302 [Conticribra weissflogii]
MGPPSTLPRKRNDVAGVGSWSDIRTVVVAVDDVMEVEVDVVVAAAAAEDIDVDCRTKKNAEEGNSLVSNDDDEMAVAAVAESAVDVAARDLRDANIRDDDDRYWDWDDAHTIVKDVVVVIAIEVAMDVVGHETWMDVLN